MKATVMIDGEKNGAVVDHLSQGPGRRKRSRWPRPEEEFESSRGTSECLVITFKSPTP